MTYVGHATVLLALDGVRLLTDPLLRTRVAHLRRRVPLDARVLRGIDAVLVSHAHYDHLDLPSLERLGRSLTIVAPRGLGRLLRRRRFERVLEIDVGESASLGALRVTATHADHGGERRPLGARGPALGYVVEGSRRVYFAGDTDLFEEMSSLAGGLDVALVPISGWGRKLGRGHLDPERAAHALALLHPRIAIPIHWGTYSPIHRGVRRDPSLLDRPTAEFVAAAAAVAPGVDIRVLAPGESLELPRSG